MTPQRVSLITLGAADLDRAAAYYAALGWRAQADSPPGVVFYQLDGQVLALFPKAELAADMGRAGLPLFSGAVTLAQNFATKDEVDAAHDAAVTAGGHSLRAPGRVEWGGYTAYVADPDGHPWELAMNPFWPLRPDGRLVLPGAVERMAEMEMTVEEEAGITALLARCFTTDFGGRSFFQTRHHLRLVIRDGTAPVAHLAISFRAVRLGARLQTVAGLAEVATDPAHRGKGHAARLVAAAIAEARAARVPHVLLFGTAGVYGAAGFRPAANRLTYLDLRGAKSHEMRYLPAQHLQVLDLGATPWEEDAPLDLLGGLF
jgi:hypothetical protein